MTHQTLFYNGSEDQNYILHFLNSKYPLSNDIIEKFENIQIEYELNDKESLYTAIALSLIKKDYESAYMTLSLMKNIYKDSDIRYLLGIRNIQDGDFIDATNNISMELLHRYINIEILHLDKYLHKL